MNIPDKNYVDQEIAHLRRETCLKREILEKQTADYDRRIELLEKSKEALTPVSWILYNEDQRTLEDKLQKLRDQVMEQATTSVVRSQILSVGLIVVGWIVTWLISR